MYAPNTKNSRKTIWKTLSNIKSEEQNGKWIIMGDFNVPLYDQEKQGRNASQVDGRLDLMEFINKEGLMDLDLHGIQFTSTNKRIGNDCIQAHLDRGLISPDWNKDFVCTLNAIKKISNDHFCLLFKA